MANILIHPNSGIIEFSTGTAGGGQFNPNFTGGALAARMIYDNYGGLNFTSYVSNPTGLERFSIDGADGRLFSVTDSLSGSIFSVNDIAGLPIIEAFDDNTVVMGAFNRNDFVITGNSVGIGALPNTGTQKLFVSGNFAVSGSSVFSVRPTVNGTGVLLSGEAATPQNLATTGSALDTKINSLSGYSNSTFATITNLALTGSNLQTQINNLDLNYATDESVSGVATNLATTGSTLNTKIDNLSGYSNNIFATITNLASTGSTLNTRINSLSGYVNSASSNIVFTTGNQTIGGYKTFTGENFALQIGGSGLEKLTVDGSNGRLFAVTDSFSGSLFSVNNIAGLPVIEAFDNNKVVMGAFNRNDFIITGNSVGIGALPNTGTQKLFVSGNFAVSGSSVFSIRPNVNGTGVVLSGEAATPQDLATTGSTLDTKINSLSGYSNSTFATIANLALTGSSLQTQINNLDLNYATDASVSGVATNLATTGSTLNTKIDNLSGYSNNTFATITNLASTGSTLNTRINSLSGYVNSTSSNIVYTTGNQTISGSKIFSASSYVFSGADVIFINNTGIVSGEWRFANRPTVNGTGVVLSGEAATPQNLATTGSTLNTRINSLSGYINSPFSNIVFTTGNQVVSGIKTFVDNTAFLYGINIGSDEQTVSPVIKMYDAPNSDYNELTWEDGLLTFTNYPDNVPGTSLIYNFGAGNGTIAVDERVVHNIGDEIISGIKTFITVNEPFSVLSITNQTINFPLNSGMNFILPLTTGITGITFSNAPTNTYSFTLRVDYSGAHAIVWPTGTIGRVLWPNNTAPTLTTTVGREDFFSFLTYTSGQEFFGFTAGQNYSGIY